MLNVECIPKQLKKLNTSLLFKKQNSKDCVNYKGRSGIENGKASSLMRMLSNKVEKGMEEKSLKNELNSQQVDHV